MKDFYDPSAGSLLNPFTNGYKDVYKQRIDLFDGPSDKRLRELDGGKASEMGIVPAAGFSFDGKLARGARASHGSSRLLLAHHAR